MKVLIAEDSNSDRLILVRLINGLGHSVIEASDGTEAVNLFREAQPDLVLLDALMPRMDGMEAARQIKAIAGERLVPLIFLTSLTGARDLARCLDAGGDDFLVKPYNRVVLEAKINAFNRMRAMHQALSDQRDHIRRQHLQILEEQRTARRVFDNIAHTGCLDAPNIRHHASPLSVFNGDVLFAAQRPGGGTLVFLGDFTGHGLPAAIGAMPVAEIFYGMAAKGFGATDILTEVNRKLRRIMPVGMFCCGLMIEADFKYGSVRAWNGGLPDAWLVRSSGDRVPISSRHLPLGVLEPERFSVSMMVIDVSPGDWLVLMTDGFPEARNGRGECLGEDGVESVLAKLMPWHEPFEALLAEMREHTGLPDLADDLTLCCLQIIEPGASESLPGKAPESVLSGPADWHCVYELRDRTLADFNPLPLLLHICLEVPGLRSWSGEIYTMLSELYNNALEHGVLALPSAWKTSPGGFSRYYQERSRRLEQVHGHHIRFSLSHQPGEGGGTLTIVCEDSGDGFDYAEYTAARSDVPMASATGYAGRGLAILRRMARKLRVHSPGNRVEVIYDWRLPGTATSGGAALPTNEDSE
ncbi:SpoIIE family protein phosphatase [Marinobacter daepoensis]|uniref:SpoIIE family protein phosphatase n=1 Tax=Marinobacter daepoensis TaxID=262077 RepID=A0ABS3BCR9_9GAMM|nr:SpoIIE family protein phosphatase [Marinobacter daepoensis]MBN7769613.1 SpoIIE family protein phosphatase [Marinobacter daepoensis]MBY6078303.1 SpoIIE family protein phosphatase [Marinobacter daepoensis]